MAKSQLKVWLTDYKDMLEDLVKMSRTDAEIYNAMGINKSTFYDYMKDDNFSDIIKNAKVKRIKENAERLKKNYDAMWEKATGYVVKETVKQIKDKNGKSIVETTKEYSHDSTLMIYLDKTYGNNINHDEVLNRAELTKARAEQVRLEIDTAVEIEDMDDIRAEVYEEDTQDTDDTI